MPWRMGSTRCLALRRTVVNQQIAMRILKLLLAAPLARLLVSAPACLPLLLTPNNTPARSVLFPHRHAP